MQKSLLVRKKELSLHHNNKAIEIMDAFSLVYNEEKIQLLRNDEILQGIYQRACKKFFDMASDSVVFTELAKYIEKQLLWRKQSLYEWGLPMLWEVCGRISESFQDGCEYVCPDAKNYRDLYYAIFE